MIVTKCFIFTPRTPLFCPWSPLPLFPSDFPPLTRLGRENVRLPPFSRSRELDDAASHSHPKLKAGMHDPT